MQHTNKNYYTVKELADILHVSRVTVFRKIQDGHIKAEKIGRNYIVRSEELEDIIYGGMSDKLKREIEKGVAKVIREYGETLKLLGKE